MRKGLRLFIYSFWFIVITAALTLSACGALAADTGGEAVKKTKTAKKTTQTSKKAVKKTTKKPAITVSKSAMSEAEEVIDLTKQQKEAADKELVYDLGNIVVRGEDKTSIKDKSKKRTAFLTPEAGSEYGEKKGAADYVAGPVVSGMRGEEMSGTTKAFIEAGVGSDSTSSAAGMLIYERNSPRDNMYSKSTVGGRGEKSGGYRYKSDYTDLNVNYKYEGIKNGENSTYAELSYDKNDRNLPGFDRFENSYTNIQGGVLKLDAKYADNSQRFTAGIKKGSRDYKIKAAAVDETYDSSVLSFGYCRDIIYDRNELSLPLTLEFAFDNDSLDVKNAQSSSAVSTRFGANAEKALNEKMMVQLSPQVYKNGENDAKVGGAVSLILKENKGENVGLKAEYVLSAGRQALKYDAANFLFPDENTVVSAKNLAGANRFDGKTYENDEKYIQLSAKADLSEDTRVSASYKNAKSDGLLYLTDLNLNDARYTFNSFAGGARVNKFDIKAAHKLDKGLEADIALTALKITDSVNDLMPYIPKNEYVFGLNYTHDNGLFVRFNYIVKDSMDSSKNPAANLKVDRYSTAGIYADKNFSDNGKIYFKADNIFNADLKLRPGYGYKARTFGIGVNYVY